MPDLRSSVAEFHRVMGTPHFQDLNRFERIACAALRATLISEEGQEVREADEAYRRNPSNEALLHLAKEIADVMYVTAGAADILRTPLVDPRKPENLLPQFFAVGTVVQRAVRAIDSLDMLAYQIDIGWEYTDLFDAVDEIGSRLQELTEALVGMAYAYGIPIYEVFDAVHASNMTKINPETGDRKYREDGKILKGPGYHPPDLSFLTHNVA